MVSRLQRFRNNHRYQRFLHAFKWRFLPDWVVTPVILLLMVWLGLAVYAQTRLPMLEHSDLCRSAAGTVSDISVTTLDFRTRELCSASFGLVRQDERYVVLLDVVEPWFDGDLAATPEGLPAGAFPWGLGYLAAPLRRVVDANYLQPLIEIRQTENGRSFLGSNVHIYPLQTRPVADSRTMYRAEFVAPRTGELFLFANDAMLPSRSGWLGRDYRYFYEASGTGPEEERGNRGSACVRVERANLAAPGTPTVHAAGPICARATLRDEGGASSRALTR
jgi:hypothetical protein